MNQVNLNLHTINIKNMKLPKDLGLIVFIFLVLISLVLITYPKIMRPTGVIVTYVGANTPCGDIMSIGSTITGIGNKLVTNSDDFSEATEELEGVVTFLINGNPRSCNIPKGMKLNVSVADKKTEGIKLGTDIWGGIYYLLEIKEPSQNLIDHIEQRLVKYELRTRKLNHTTKL